MKKKTKTKRIREPQPMELCCVREGDEKWFESGGGFPVNSTFIYLGEIKNMQGHGVYLEHWTGKTFSGMHTDNFRVLTEEEI